MIDLHTHTLFSDGVLLPSELVYRGKVKGYKAIALTDHADFSNIDFILPRIVKISKLLTSQYNINVIPGIELTCVPPDLILKAKLIAKKMGAKIILVHGESIAEPVPKGTNLKAILAEVDILAHPGRIKEDEVKLAAQKNVYLELTTRKLHAKSNPHIYHLARKYKVKLILSSDAHQPEDLLEQTIVENILKSINTSSLTHLIDNAKELVRKCLKG